MQHVGQTSVADESAQRSGGGQEWPPCEVRSGTHYHFHSNNMKRNLEGEVFQLRMGTKAVHDKNFEVDFTSDTVTMTVTIMHQLHTLQSPPLSVQSVSFLQTETTVI